LIKQQSSALALGEKEDYNEINFGRKRMVLARACCKASQTMRVGDGERKAEVELQGFQWIDDGAGDMRSRMLKFTH
jgi:hypothetical protein